MFYIAMIKHGPQTNGRAKVLLISQVTVSIAVYDKGLLKTLYTTEKSVSESCTIS